MRIYERVIQVILVLLVAAGFVYSCFWYYRADSVKSALAISLLQYRNFEFGSFTYSAIRVKGFPFAFRIELIEPELIIAQPPHSQEKMKGTKYYLPKIVINPNVEEGLYSISPEGTVHIVTAAGRIAEADIKGPVSVVKVSRKGWWELLSSGIGFSDMLSYHYEDNGMNVITDGKKRTIFSSEGTSVSFTHKLEGLKEFQEIMAHTTLIRGEALSDFLGEATPKGKTLSVGVDVASEVERQLGTTEQDTKLLLKNISVQLDDMNVNVMGKTVGVLSDPYAPNISADIVFETSDYPRLLDTVAQLGWVDNAHREIISQMLPDITEERSGNYLKTRLRRVPGEREFYLGKLPLLEVQSRFIRGVNQ